MPELRGLHKQPGSAVQIIMITAQAAPNKWVDKRKP